MNIVFLLLPLSLLLALIGVGAYFWLLRNGQLDDLETPAMRILWDSDEGGKNSSPIQAERDVANSSKETPH